jgi:hypothetical protein
MKELGNEKLKANYKSTRIASSAYENSLYSKKQKKSYSPKAQYLFSAT